MLVRRGGATVAFAATLSQSKAFCLISAVKGRYRTACLPCRLLVILTWRGTFDWAKPIRHHVLFEKGWLLRVTASKRLCDWVDYDRVIWVSNQTAVFLVANPLQSSAQFRDKLRVVLIFLALLEDYVWWVHQVTDSFHVVFFETCFVRLWRLRSHITDTCLLRLSRGLIFGRKVSQVVGSFLYGQFLFQHSIKLHDPSLPHSYGYRRRRNVAVSCCPNADTSWAAASQDAYCW